MARSVTYSVVPRINPRDKEAAPKFYAQAQARGDVNIREIAFDRWGAVQMVQNLEGMGFTVVTFGQGFKDMSPPTKELMKLVLEERISHGGHPVLRWMMDNIFIRTDLFSVKYKCRLLQNKNVGRCNCIL